MTENEGEAMSTKCEAELFFILMPKKKLEQSMRID